MTGIALQTTSHGRKYRSRTELEIDRMDLCEHLEREKLQLWVTEDRLQREMKTSIALGMEVVELERQVRSLTVRLDFAQRKLGHRV